MKFFKYTLLLSTALLLNFQSSLAMKEEVKEEVEVKYSYRKSSYQSEAWRDLKYLKKPSVPCISKNDLLSFNTVKIITNGVHQVKKNVSKDTFLPKTKFHDVGTGFLVWSSYKLDNTIPFIQEYYNNEGDLLLVTCKHGIETIKEEKKIKSFEFEINYINPTIKNFYLLKINLSKKNEKVFWETGKNDIAALRLGNILQKGKEWLDLELSSSHYPFFKAIEKGDYKDEKSVGYLSDVFMFGYPYQLSASNGMPLARFGHCSTDPKQSMLDSQEGKADFYIDMASIKGSSGSPVWFYFKKISGNLIDKTVNLENEFVEETIPYVNEAELFNDEVDITEEITFNFAGMLFGGPEQENDKFHDIHLGMVLNKKSVLSFLQEINNNIEKNYVFTKISENKKNYTEKFSDSSFKIEKNIPKLELIFEKPIKIKTVEDEIEIEYKKISENGDLKHDELIEQVHSSQEPTKLSMNDWIIYVKHMKKKTNEKKLMEEFNFIKFKTINSFNQLFTFFQNEPNKFIEDINLKNLLIKSWWKSALVDKEENESLVKAYMNGKIELIIKNNKNVLILNKIMEYLEK